MWQRLREDIQCVFERDPAARSVPEVLTSYPGLHAVWLHRVSHTLWQRGLLWPARLLSHVGRGLTGIEIAEVKDEAPFHESRDPGGGSSLSFAAAFKNAS